MAYSPHHKNVLLSGLGCGLVPKICSTITEQPIFVNIRITIYDNTTSKVSTPMFSWSGIAVVSVF